MSVWLSSVRRFISSLRLRRSQHEPLHGLPKVVVLGISRLDLMVGDIESASPYRENSLQPTQTLSLASL